LGELSDKCLGEWLGEELPSIFSESRGVITGWISCACAVDTIGGLMFVALLSMGGFKSVALLSDPRGVALGVESGNEAVKALKTVVARIGRNVLPRDPGLR